MPSQSASVHQALWGLASFIAKNQSSKSHTVAVIAQGTRLSVLTGQLKLMNK